TTHEFSFELGQIKEVCFDENFDFRVEIVCGDRPVYDSQMELYRPYLVFNENGYESIPAKCQNGKAWVAAPSHTEVKIIDPDDHYCDESMDFKLYQVSLLSAKEIWANGIDLLAQEEAKDLSIRSYCVSDAAMG